MTCSLEKVLEWQTRVDEKKRQIKVVANMVLGWIANKLGDNADIYFDTPFVFTPDEPGHLDVSWNIYDAYSGGDIGVSVSVQGMEAFDPTQGVPIIVLADVYRSLEPFFKWVVEEQNLEGRTDELEHAAQ